MSKSNYSLQGYIFPGKTIFFAYRTDDRSVEQVRAGTLSVYKSDNLFHQMVKSYDFEIRDLATDLTKNEGKLMRELAIDLYESEGYLVLNKHGRNS